MHCYSYKKGNINSGEKTMETKVDFKKLFKKSALLIIVLTSLCATCVESCESAREYPVTVTASSTNLDPVHVMFGLANYRLAPGESKSYTIKNSHDTSDFCYPCMIFRMEQLLSTTTVRVVDKKMTHVLIQETSYGQFSVTYTNDD